MTVKRERRKKYRIIITGSWASMESRKARADDFVWLKRNDFNPDSESFQKVLANCCSCIFPSFSSMSPQCVVPRKTLERALSPQSWYNIERFLQVLLVLSSTLWRYMTPPNFILSSYLQYGQWYYMGQNIVTYDNLSQAAIRRRITPSW